MTTRAPAKRKTSPRGPTGIKKPNSSAFMKARWEDPEYREKQLANLHANRGNRTRVPDGMRKAQAQKLWSKAETLAERFITMLKDDGELPEVTVPGSDEAMATEALREAFVLAIGPGDGKLKTANIRTVLEWTRAKPESKSKLTLEKSEDWLAAAQAEMDSGDTA
jgi:hypothetical protein